ncbi:MAG: ParB/RepB/Spo0J family partition protein [Spirochaetales bacterium]|nr:ParB/RepB/Spo0J family partition protein [Spirochaetales bacterium]MDY5915605.1 ParB/RepB/Spo0J family partition protein [Treponema sp.]
MAKNALGKGLGALLHENTTFSESKKLQSLSENSPNANLKLPENITVEEDGSLWVDPALLIPNPKQPRLEFDQKKLDELCDSIKVNGILQPIIIEDSGNGKFYIIAGERRTRAAKMAGLTKVPVQLRKFDEQQKLEMALIENIQRADLNPIEEATAYYNLIQMGDLSQDEVAKRVGKARATVANSIRLLRLPEDIKKALSNGQISSGHARALLMVKTDSELHILFGKIVGQGMSVREAEEEAKKLNEGSRAASNKKQKKEQPQKDADVLNFEQELKNIFGTKSINLKGDINKGSIVIGFDTRKDFDRIYDVLMSKR